MIVQPSHASLIGYRGRGISPKDVTWLLEGRKWWVVIHARGEGWDLTLGPAKSKRALCRKWRLTFEEDG